MGGFGVPRSYSAARMLPAMLACTTGYKDGKVVLLLPV